MAVEVVDLNQAYICLSTDTKPTNPTYRRLYEVDTGVQYAWNGSAWVTYSEPFSDLGQVALTGFGLVTETLPLNVCNGSTILTTGTTQAVLAPFRAGQVVTNLLAALAVAGAGQTLVKMGIYDTAGNQLAVTADVKAAFAGSAGLVENALTATWTCPATGVYYIAVLGVGGTQPTLVRQAVGTTNPGLISAVGGRPRLAVTEGSQTDLDATATFGASGGIGFWFGAS